MKCCTTTTVGYLGTFGHCETVELPILAEQTGMFTARWDWLGGEFRREIPVETGTPIKIDTKWFNEYADTEIRFYDPQGQQLQLRQKEEITTLCNTFTSFRIVIKPSYYSEGTPVNLLDFFCGHECMLPILTTP